MALTVGQSYSETFTITQEQINAFAEVTGDKNPLHLDAAFAATTPFKKPIAHGIYGAGVFSRILGTKFPGEGSVYMKQDVQFKRPMYIGETFTATVTIKEIDNNKHTALLETKIEDSNNKITCVGEAQVMNKDCF